MSTRIKSPKYRPGHFCEECDAPLLWTQTYPSTIKSGNGRFCSRKCKGRWMSSNFSGENSPLWMGGAIERICEICGKGFTAIPAVIKIGSGRFCSRKCMGQWQSVGRAGENSSRWKGGKVERTCEICNTVFFVASCMIEIGKGRFCSQKCNGQWLSESLSGRNHPNWRGGKVERVCEVCDSVFVIAPAALKEGSGRFCSRKCKGRWMSENLVGENHPSWRGGKSFEPYPSTFNGAFKLKIRQRDEYTCAICGAPDSKDVHHINYIKDDTIPENCITLCRSCHGKTNANRPCWQALLASLMQDRGFADCKASLLGVELHWVEEE